MQPQLQKLVVVSRLHQVTDDAARLDQGVRCAVVQRALDAQHFAVVKC